jgi:hypothetical protein
MTEQQPIQQKIQELANQAIAEGNPSSWFEIVYSESLGDVNQVPWAKLTPHEYLQEWLHIHHPSQEKYKALVIGCGLGDDAEALAQKQYQSNN